MAVLFRLVSRAVEYCRLLFSIKIAGYKFQTKENKSIINPKNQIDRKAGGSLPYSWKTAAKQPYLKDFFCRWRSESLGRSRASPHLKSYTRISPDQTKAAWFLMTSANLSKAAWGSFEKNGSQLMIRSYEIGVLFLPQDFDPSQKHFSLVKNLSESSLESNNVFLRLPYDLPVEPYTNEDHPWLWDRQHSQPDVHGQRWNP